MQESLIWQCRYRPGMEYFEIFPTEQGYYAKGRVIGMTNESPFFVRYEIHCDLQWHCQHVRLHKRDHDGEAITLRSDWAGHWLNREGQPIPALDGCSDVDISVTPFTNTLPIRRLGLEIGVRTPINVVYFNVDEYTVSPMGQAYTKLSENVYRYENLDGSFSAEITVDADGLVEDYPQLFRRLRNSQSY